MFSSPMEGKGSRKGAGIVPFQQRSTQHKEEKAESTKGGNSKRSIPDNKEENHGGN